METILNVDETIFQQATYDSLFFRRKDPIAANLYLLALELEQVLISRGMKARLCNFQAKSGELTRFLDKNRDTLLLLFPGRFPDPAAYSFTGILKNKSLEASLNRGLQ